MPNNKNSFNKLKEHWYKKLKKDGFQDLEKMNNTPKSYNGGVPYALRSKKAQVVIDAQESYYNMCSHFLNDHKFANERDKIIWSYHAEGLSEREIRDVLRKVGIKTRSKGMIGATIRSLVEEMKKKYLVI